MWGSGVIVPPKGHEMIVKELHESHPGISRMKESSQRIRVVTRSGSANWNNKYIPVVMGDILVYAILGDINPNNNHYREF